MRFCRLHFDKLLSRYDINHDTELKLKKSGTNDLSELFTTLLLTVAFKDNTSHYDCLFPRNGSNRSAGTKPKRSPFLAFYCKMTEFCFQMVQNGTYLIGCGYAVCPNTRYKRFYVCNYAAG